MLLYVTQQTLTIPLYARLRFGWVAGLQLLFQVGVLATAAILALAGAGLLPFLAMQVPIMLPVLAFTVLLGGHEARAMPVVDASEWRRMLSQILAYSTATVLAALYFRAAQILVSLLSSGAQSGYFGASFRLLDGVITIAPLLVSTALPILARAANRDTERFAYAGRRIAETMVIAGVGLALALFLGAEFAIDLVAGPGFEDSVDVLRILAVALVGTFVIAARGYALLSLGLMRAMLISNAIALATVAAVGVPLIQAHGAIGAAITVVAAELAVAVSYEVALTRRRQGLRLPIGFVARVACSACAAVAVATLAGVSSLAAAMLGAGIYAAALLLLRVIPTELLHLLRWPGTTWGIGGS